MRALRRAAAIMALVACATAVAQQEAASPAREVGADSLTATPFDAAPAGSLATIVAARLGEIEADTGAALVCGNLEAFALRALSARAAQHSLDLLYYTWHADITGMLLARDVLRAADRGVQVRLLLDDLYVRGSDRAVGALAAHPSIEVRLFNPFRTRSWGAFGTALEFVFAAARLNHRMHNKAWIVDGQLVVGGGRNIGDEYFDAAAEVNFRDLDVLIVGLGAAQASREFDRYWASAQAVPVEAFDSAAPMDDGLAELRERLESAAESARAEPYLQRLQTSPVIAQLVARQRSLLAVDDDALRIISDPPEKARGERGGDLLDAIVAALGEARREVLLISPYFVPGERGAEMLIELVRRGVKISVLTNSLAATDVTAVHSGYARYRERLLQAGIRLFELKRSGATQQSSFGSSGASLHTKAFVVDDSLIFVSSFNLDPRSVALNTEMGAFVRHAELARQLREEHERLCAPERSYEVVLQDGQLVWIDRRQRTALHARRARRSRGCGGCWRR